MHLKHISTIFKKFPLYIANLMQIMEMIKFYMYCCYKFDLNHHLSNTCMKYTIEFRNNWVTSTLLQGKLQTSKVTN